MAEPGPAIPMRTSSLKRKAPAETSSEAGPAKSQAPEEPRYDNYDAIQVQATLEGLDDELKRLNAQADTLPATSGELFWVHSMREDILVKRQMLFLRRAEIKHHADSVEGTDFASTRVAQEHTLHLRTHKSSRELFAKHSQKLEASNLGGATPTVKAAFCENILVRFFNYKRNNSDAMRKSAKMLREKVLQKYGGRTEARTAIWCPITHIMHSAGNVKATHIFPNAAGHANMKAIFELDELHTPLNVILMCSEAEERFDASLFALVPHAERTEAGIAAWRKTEPRDYVFRVIDPKAARMKEPVFGLEKTWVELDGQVVAFKTDARPRARYLYWHWACSVIKKARMDNAEQLEQRQKDVYWGTRGRWFKKSMLVGFAEICGHEFEWALPTEAGVDDGEEPDYALALAVNQHLARPDEDGAAEEEEDRSEDESDEEY